MFIIEVLTKIIWFTFVAYSDKGYLVRVLLAVLDHNHHINQSYKPTSTSKSTMKHRKKRQFHRIRRRRSNRWDVIPVKVDKDYGYIMDITKATPVPLGSTYNSYTTTSYSRNSE